MMKWLLGGCLLLTMAVGVTAQSPQTYSSSDILLQLQKLKVLGSVLYVAAHPDDENTRLLAYLSKDKKYRTGYLSLTRGDGGQNLIGNEQGVSLGLIRTQELLAARRIDGAEQFFTRAYDFGFSKSTDEALRTWKKDKILSDVVWVIRKFRPDVIITRFPPDERAGHGHHSASAVLAHEAFKAAADPNMFPEQLKLVKPWQPKRILWNTYNFGSNNTQSEEQFKLDVGAYNPLLGKSYGELAAESRSQHKSQGFGVPSQRGTSLEYFSHTDGQPIQSDLFDGVISDWSRTGNAPIAQRIDAILRKFNPTAPATIVNDLQDLYLLIDEEVKDLYWKQQKLEEIRRLLKACLGVYFEATANQQVAVTGDSLRISLQFINRSNVPLYMVRVQGMDTSFVLAEQTRENLPYTKMFSQLITADFISDQPYWLREQMDTGSFTVNTNLLIGAAQNTRNDFKVSFYLGKMYLDEYYSLQYKHTDPVKGEIFQPVITVPPVVVGTQPGVVLNNLEPRHPQFVQLSYKSYVQRDTVRATIRFELTNGKTLREKRISQELPLVRNTMQSITLPLDSLLTGQTPDLLYPWLELPGKSKSTSYNNALRMIEYDHIPTVHYFFPNSVKVINEPIRTAGKRIGYIPGSGDGTGDALKQMGFTVDILDDAILASGDLSRYDAIVTGVRAYNVKESLNNYYDRLMNYINNGGNLIVQYNTSNQLGLLRSRIGPYPFTIARNRITDEKATVKFENPSHPLLNFPNKITAKDFDGWVQERSIYHAANFDKRYETIFTMNDPGESPDSGSLIMARYGKGYFIYTGLVFFRQLPAGVPGAYRLLANLVALNQKKAF